jgi:O-acetyl-ADP-ribose deacetylase (regulator of RNase III)
MGGEKSVDPGTILVTSAGELTRTHGVRRVFHAAAVMGSVGYGYQPVPNIESCVSNALDTADSASYAPELLRTILFPLMGTGTGGADQSEGVARLIDAAVAYFARRPKTVVTTAYFLALTDKQRELCLRTLRRSETVELTKK